MVHDINPGSGGSGPSYITAIGNTVYFEAFDRTNGGELWKSDGTADGTSLVKDIYSGSGSSRAGDYPEYLTVMGGKMYFGAIGSSMSWQLWKSDGTEEGTVLVKDIAPGYQESYPLWLTVIGDSFFFAMDDAIHGWELWKSDGTEVGTVMVKDINPGSGSSKPEWLSPGRGGPVHP